MSAPAPWKEQLREQLLARRLTFNDRAMLAIAALDIVLLAVRRDVDLPGDLEEVVIAWIHVFDFVVVGIFAIEFLASFFVAEKKVAFLKANWYDLVGLVPIHSALLRAFRLGRAVRIFVWGSRFPDEVARETGGDPYMLHVLRRYEPVLVEELTDPLLLRVLKVLRRVVGQGRYANAVGDSLQARRDELHVVVADAIAKSPALRLAYGFPPVKAGIDEIEKETMDVMIGALTDPRLDAVIRAALDDALAGLEARVVEKEWQRAQAPAPS